MTELEEYIQSYFGHIQSNALNKITSLFTISTIKKDNYFLKKGQHCDRLSFIQSGFLRIFATAEDKEVTQWISAKGYFVTDLAGFVFEHPSRWNVQALADTEIYSITRHDYQLLNDIVPGWHNFEKSFIVKCFAIMEDRIFSHLCMSAEERYQFFFEKNGDLFNQVPLQYIASMLGMTAETFSRIRKKQ